MSKVKVTLVHGNDDVREYEAPDREQAEVWARNEERHCKNSLFGDRDVWRAKNGTQIGTNYHYVMFESVS